MSFAQLHEAAAAAAADCAYLEDVRAVQQLLQQLRQRAAAVWALRRFHLSKEQQQQPKSQKQPPHQQRPQRPASFEDQQRLQELLQRELGSATRVALSTRHALRQLQRHIAAAASFREKEARQQHYAQMHATAEKLLRQLRDAAAGEECFLQQQHQLLLQADSRQEPQQQQEQALENKRKGLLFTGNQSLQPLEDAAALPAPGAAEVGARAPAAAAPQGNDWRSHERVPSSKGYSGGPSTATEQIELAEPSPRHGAPVSRPAAICPGPLQLQHQLQRQAKSVPILIPESKVDASLLREKLDGLAKIHQEVRAIQSVYEQMAFFTEEQGQRLDAVDQGLSRAREQAARATWELREAARAERKRRCRRCFFFACLLLVVMLLAAAMWWNVAH